MKLDQWLAQATAKLTGSHIPTARLDCLVLLEDATGRDRAWLLANPDQSLSELGVRGLSFHMLESYLERRAKHEPLAYIRGKSEFYGRQFMVNAHTLQPRPETEVMIEIALKLAKRNRQKEIAMIDVGTGSGAIAITMKLELPELEVIATDIDQKCLAAATENATMLGTHVTFLRGNLLEPIYNLPPTTNNLFAILANLPYVPDKYQLNKAAMFEPKHAIFGGQDGLDLYREMFHQVDKLPQKPSYILTESLPLQHKTLTDIALNSGYRQTKSQDFIQVFGRL